MLMKFTFHYSCHTAGESSQKGNQIDAAAARATSRRDEESARLLRKLVKKKENFCKTCADEKEINLAVNDSIVKSL